MDYLAFLMRGGHDIKVLKSYEGSDYQWRIIMGKRPARIAFGKLFDDLDYDNFKNEASGSEGFGNGELWDVYNATQRAHRASYGKPYTHFEADPNEEGQDQPPHGLDCSGMTAADWDEAFGCPGGSL